MAEEKLTNGLNDRPKNSSIGQSAEGFPDDSGRPLEIDEATVEAVRRKLSGISRDEPPREGKQREDASRPGSK